MQVQIQIQILIQIDIDTDADTNTDMEQSMANSQINRIGGRWIGAPSTKCWWPAVCCCKFVSAMKCKNVIDVPFAATW